MTLRLNPGTETRGRQATRVPRAIGHALRRVAGRTLESVALAWFGLLAAAPRSSRP